MLVLVDPDYEGIVIALADLRRRRLYGDDAALVLLCRAGKRY
jgi:hypothetical protein